MNLPTHYTIVSSIAFCSLSLKTNTHKPTYREVELENTAAVGLYEGAGFRFEKNPTAFTKRKFMVKNL